MASHTFYQDMPPEGGYGKIQYDRIPLKKPWSGYRMFSVWVGVTAFGFYLNSLNTRYSRAVKRENDDVHVSLEPLLLAERDRMFLSHIYKNREEEADLMKNVPGWKVGTWYGEPLYKTTGDKILDISFDEYYAHANPKEKRSHRLFDFWI